MTSAKSIRSTTRIQIVDIIKEIKSGKTFYRSKLAQTLKNKLLWDELRAEVEEGFPIDLPEEPAPLKMVA